MLYNHQDERASALSHAHQRMCCHRAIDDLYTLAEMDGNLWQARNIVQLLDESTTDFRQVSSCLNLECDCLVRETYTHHAEVTSFEICSCKPFFRAKDAMTMAFMRREHGPHESLSHHPGTWQPPLTSTTHLSTAESCYLQAC